MVNLGQCVAMNLTSGEDRRILGMVYLNENDAVRK
jgi:hypothetical protein